VDALVDALRRAWLRLRFYLFRARYDREMEEEMRHHLELRAAEYESDGLSEADARYAAVRRFGNRGQLQEQRRSAVGLAWLETLGQDTRYVFRSLRASPGFTVMVVLTLGLGIGANATMFGIIDQLLLRGPDHVVDPKRVVRLYSTERHDTGVEFTGNTVPYALYAEMQQVRAFERVAAQTSGESTTGRGIAAQRISVGRVTWEYFPLLGVRPALGRFFGPQEDRPPRGESVVVLGDGYWRRAFGGDPAVVGRTLEINRASYRIIGVAPEGFTGPTSEGYDVWAPLSEHGPRVDAEWPTTWNVHWVRVIGRLKPGVTPEQAGLEATAVHRRAYPGGPPERTIANAQLSVRPLRFDHHGREPTEIAVSRWLVGVAVVVLLVACANAGNLVLARTVRRRREVAVRLALGISRGRLVRLLLAESIVLSLAGGVAGVLVALGGGRFLRAVLLPGGTPINGRVLVLTAVAALVTGVLVGLVPALQGSRPDLTTALKAGAREGGAQRSRLRTTLTVVQAALSVVLLVGAGLFVRSLWNVRSLRLGVEPDRVLTVDVAEAWAAGHAGVAQSNETRALVQMRDLFARALERVRAIRGVESASISNGTPFHGSTSFALEVPGWDSIPKLPGGGPYVSSVTSDYFRTMGTRLRRGRLFTAEEGATGARVAVVSETMARTLWPGRDPMGRCLMMMGSSGCWNVIGVVENSRRFQVVGEAAAMQYYVPLGQDFMGGQLLIRFVGARAPMIEMVRRELQRLDPGIGYISVRSPQDNVDWQVRPWRLGATMFVVFGALALLVAAIGLYSLIAYLVAQRTHELGIRMALGARAADIARLVMGRGVGAAAAGVAVGVGLALALGRLVQPLLFEISSHDAGVFLAVTATLLTCAVLASLVPTWRATRVDPVTALRSET
jgi:predicted permease